MVDPPLPQCQQHWETRCTLAEGHPVGPMWPGVNGHMFDFPDQPTPTYPVFGDSLRKPAVSNDRTEQLAQWWRDQAESEIAQTVAKAVEYSGTLGGLPQDLVDLGRQIAFVQRREHDFTDAELAEIGVWSYIQGKVNRWSSALRNGRMVSDDSLLDVGIYVRIAQHLRFNGEWP